MKLKRQISRIAWSPTLIVCLLAGCDMAGKKSYPVLTPSVPPVESADPSRQNPASPPIVAAARSQVGRTTMYDPAYVSLPYPGGDVPMERGVCTDVIVRALRESLDMDLQKLLHEDMKSAFSQYPTIWGLKKPDRNIDHRRVPNLATYFRRRGYSVGASQRPEDYLPGDLVACTVGNNRPHIMIVSDRKTAEGVPLVIHNIGSGAKEENRLFDFPITGHYRVKTNPIANPTPEARGANAPQQQR